MVKKIVDGVVSDMTADEEAWLNANQVAAQSDEEIALEHLREERNFKLKQTDYYALSDVTMSSEMTTYRQALRDLPSNYTTSDSASLSKDLSNLNWPTKP